MKPTFRHAALGLLAGMGALAAAPALACPNYQLTGQQLTYTAQDVWVPQSHSVVAGGNVNLASCGIGGHGYVITNPDFELNLTDNTPGYEIEFRVEAACDTVLLVNDAYAQWQFNDDSDGFNPRIRIADAPAATYDIWVGTFSNQNCQANLIIESFPGAGPSQPQAPSALPDPGNLTSFRNQTGAMLSFTVTGSDRGSVWGSGLYTDDSTLAVAAVHAGVLAVGETAVVDVVIEPGQASYAGSTANGITSSNYGSWSGSYSFPAAPAAPSALPDPGNLTSFRGQTGAVLSFTVTGSDRGSVWGSGLYTDDSTLAVAAVHAGVLRVGETAVVEVRIEPGQASYSGSSANGVTSANYGSWSGSYSFPAAPAPAAPAAPSGGASK